MSAIDFRAARGPAAVFGHDDASRRLAAFHAARAIVSAARLPAADRPSPRPADEGGAPPARPALPPRSRAGGGLPLDAVIAGVALLTLALVAAVFLLAEGHPSAGGLWL